MSTIRALAAAAAVAAAAVAFPAAAQDASGGWKTFKKDGRCWAAAWPAGSPSQEGSAPYLSIQNYPAEGVKGSVAAVAASASSGEGDVKLAVNGQGFDVLPYGGAAFVASGKPEAALISAMKRGRELVVTWTDSSGRSTADTYSLIGFTAAKEEIDRMCP